MRVLGIETSCDETGIALYEEGRGLLSEALYSQVALHAVHGGVVPELASRDHINKIFPLIRSVFDQAGLKPGAVDGVAYTAGPGLVGALLVGALVGRSMAYAWQVPAVPVHHMEGHLLAPMLEPDPPSFPFVALLISGGHTQLIRVGGFGDYALLGETVDDAVGECFDKIARLMGLGYPGGAALEQMAAEGDPTRFHFPRPMVRRPGLMFSFSGLKTAAANVLRTVDANDLDARRAVARAFQDAIVDTLVIKCRRALTLTGWKTLVVAGGVSANGEIRRGLENMTAALGARVFFPRHAFCTDNGAMIAYAGCWHLLQGEKTELAVKVFPRWPLGESF